MDHSYDNLVIDEAEISVILPEGARSVTVFLRTSASFLQIR